MKKIDKEQATREIVALYQQGYGIPEISNISGYSVSYTTMILKEKTNRKTRERKILTPELSNAIYADFERGDKIMDICNKWHISASTLKKIRTYHNDGTVRGRGERTTWTEAEIAEMRDILVCGGTVKQVYKQFAITKAKLVELGVLK